MVGLMLETGLKEKQLLVTAPPFSRIIHTPSYGRIVIPMLLVLGMLIMIEFLKLKNDIFHTSEFWFFLSNFHRLFKIAYSQETYQM